MVGRSSTGAAAVFILYSPNLNTFGQVSRDVAEYVGNTPDGITSGPSVSVWMVPGTFTAEDFDPRWNVNPYLRRS
jgi:hypothetical protein